jgi:hypothetical protein
MEGDYEMNKQEAIRLAKVLIKQLSSIIQELGKVIV